MIHMIRFTCIEDIQSPLNDILCSVKRSEPASWVRRLLYLLALWYISIYRTRSAPAVDGKWLFSSIGWQTTYIRWQTTYIGCQFTSIVLQFTSIGLQFMYIGIESTETDTLRPLVTLYVHWWHFTSIGWLDICVHRTIFQPSPKHWQLSRGFPTPKPKNFTWMEWKLRGIQYVWWELKWELPRWISRYTVLKKLHCQHNETLNSFA